MNSKQRVHAALRREPVDRVPVFMWFHPDTTRLLADLLEIPRALVPAAMGDDVRMTWVNNNHAMEAITHERDGEGHTDRWGIRWVKSGAFNQVADSPLAGATPQEVEAYELPVAHVDELLSNMTPVAAQGKEYFIGCDISPCGFEMYNRLRGMEDALLDIAMRPALAARMMQRCVEFSIMLGEAACERFALDWLWAGDDVAGQQAMMMSPAAWRRMLKPRIARALAVGRRHGLWTAYHCCGAIRPIIGDLVEIGLDVLNPIQCNCPGMDPLELKREFGAELAFMGGVDTQQLLPFGTAAQVRAATARLIEAMTAGGGGYILAASHTVPPETPQENIFAMYDEAGISREQIFDAAADVRRGVQRPDA